MFHQKIISHKKLRKVVNRDLFWTLNAKKIERNYYLTHFVECPEEACWKNYLGEAAIAKLMEGF